MDLQIEILILLSIIFCSVLTILYSYGYIQINLAGLISFWILLVGGSLLSYFFLK